MYDTALGLVFLIPCVAVGLLLLLAVVVVLVNTFAATRNDER